MQVIPGPTGIAMAKEIAEKLDLEYLEPEFGVYPDGESYLRFPENPKKEILIVQSCYYPQDTNLFQLINLIMTSRRLGSSRVTVFVPYLCYARADREVRGGEAVSIMTVLEILRSVGVDRLITLDLHNPKVIDKIDMRIDNIFASRSMKKFLETNLEYTHHLQIVAPDKGAINRAKELAEVMDLPFTALEKYRSPETGNVSLRLGAAELVRSEIVIVDDIISTGGTLVEASNLLLVNGIQKIHYLITHTLGTDVVDKLQETGNGIVASTNSTNSIIGTISPITDIIRVL